MKFTKLIWKKKLWICMIIVFVSVSFTVYLLGDYFLFQDLKPSRAQFSLMIWTNGTVRGFSFNTYIGNFTLSEVESISNDKCKVIARGGPDYEDFSFLSVDFYKIDSKEPILVTFTSFRNITKLAFDTSAVFFRSYPYLNIQGTSPNITKVTIYFAAFARNRLGMEMIFASNSYKGNVNGSRIEETPFPHYKSWFLTTAIAFLAFCSISATLITINLLFRFALKKDSNLLNSKILRNMYVISKNAPWCTLAMGIIMLATYVFIGTGMDFIMLNCCSGVSLWAETLFSFLFHSGYNHLLGNIMVFILSGTAIELWLKGKGKLFWYFLPLLLDLPLAILSLSEAGYPSVGASFWIIGQSITLGYYVYFHWGDLKLRNKRDLILVLITGYCLLGATYRYLSSLITSHWKETDMTLAVGHITFAVLFYFTLEGLFHYCKKSKCLQKLCEEFISCDSF